MNKTQRKPELVWDGDTLKCGGIATGQYQRKNGEIMFSLNVGFDRELLQSLCVHNGDALCLSPDSDKGFFAGVIHDLLASLEFDVLPDSEKRSYRFRWNEQGQLRCGNVNLLTLSQDDLPLFSTTDIMFEAEFKEAWHQRIEREPDKRLLDEEAMRRYAQEVMSEVLDRLLFHDQAEHLA